MSQLRTYKTLFFVGFYLLCNISYASDIAKEKRWADQIVDSIIVGDAEWLKAKGQKFLGIYNEHAKEKAKTQPSTRWAIN